MKKVDTSVLNEYTKKDVAQFNKEMLMFLENKQKHIRKEVVSYFYLLAYKLEHEKC